MNGYSLSRLYFDWAFENPSKNNPTMVALYFFIVEVNNRLGWKKEFGITPKECMDALNIGSYNTYKKNFDKLIEYGFIEIVKKSANQYQSNIIALSKFDKALDEPVDKALDKALTKHLRHSINNKTINKETNKQGEVKEVDIKKGYKTKYPFIDDEYLEAFSDWLQYKQDRKESYKSEKSVQKALTKLKNLSNNNSNTARLIVDNSMANNWAGLFELKQSGFKHPAIDYQQNNFKDDGRF